MGRVWLGGADGQGGGREPRPRPQRDPAGVPRRQGGGGEPPQAAKGAGGSPSSIRVVGEHGGSTVDLAILGGGIVGLSVAWRARAQGMSVAVFERGVCGDGATHVAAGMLAPVAEVEFGKDGRRLLDMAVRSAAMWPDFAAELEQASGVEVGLRRSGTLVVARDED